MALISVLFGDGGNPSSSDEATVRVTWAREALSAGSAHEERLESPHHLDSEISEAGAHWGRRGSCARHCTPGGERARTRHPQWESGTRPCSRVGVVPADAAGKPNRPVAERDELSGAAAGIPAVTEGVLGKASLWARGYLAVATGSVTDEVIRAYIEEQVGEQIADDSRFPIDS